ncbi:Uncharacterised protein [Porphyromonas cangingivalis]|nr:Uncharacterised protein [Porphyromonas cangingivalis]
MGITGTKITLEGIKQYRQGDKFYQDFLHIQRVRYQNIRTNKRPVTPKITSRIKSVCHNENLGTHS